MRRDGTDAVTEATRRRLEVMAEELGASAHRSARELAEHRLGEPLPDDPADAPAIAPAIPPAIAPGVQPAGRHLRRRVQADDRVAGWVADRLPLVLRGRWRLGLREVVLVVLVVTVGLGIAALAVLRSDADAVSTAMPAGPVPAPSALLATPSGDPRAGASPSGAASPSGVVVVDVAGKVRRPGVVTLPAGSRVVDALRRAGGARPHADLTALNLAAVLTDGQQVLVGVRGAAAGTPSAAAASGEAPAGPLVDLNAASQDELESLPGVGPVTAQRILAWRTAHGVFSSLDELLEVDGIGPKTLAELVPHLTL